MSEKHNEARILYVVDGNRMILQNCQLRSEPVSLTVFLSFPKLLHELQSLQVFMHSLYGFFEGDLGYLSVQQLLWFLNEFRWPGSVNPLSFQCSHIRISS